MRNRWVKGVSRLSWKWRKRSAVKLTERTHAYLLRIFEVKMNAFNIAGVVFVLSLLFMVLVSRWTGAPDPAKIASVMWRRSTLDLPREILAAGYPVYRWVSIWWVITIGIFVGL